MVEVFKTNVHNSSSAVVLLEHIHQTFMSYQATFDLEDCDKILRVQCAACIVEPKPVIDLIRTFGFEAEVLPDVLL